MSEISKSLVESAYGKKFKSKQRRVEQLQKKIDDEVQLLENLNEQMTYFEECSKKLNDVIKSADSALQDLKTCESNISLQQAQLRLQVRSLSRYHYEFLCSR